MTKTNTAARPVINCAFCDRTDCGAMICEDCVAARESKLRCPKRPLGWRPGGWVPMHRVHSDPCINTRQSIDALWDRAYGR